MDKSDQVLDLLTQKGPSLPVAVAKEIKTDMIIAGAYLSTLLSRKMIKVSYLKVGGSPLYYIKGHEARLQDFSDKLNPVDRKTYELLKERKVLRERELEPVERVSLKQLRDFAVPLNVKIGSEMEVFWKWYLLSEDETGALVRKGLHILEVPREVPKPAEEPKIIAKPIEKAVLEKKEAVAIKEEAPEEKRRAETIREPPAVAIIHEKPIPIVAHVGSQRVLIKESDLQDKFFDAIREYFSKNRIEITETNIIKKGLEIDMIIEVPSAVGKLTYYCKAKNKKRNNEGDLAGAFVQAQMRKIPALYLTRGDITKRADEMLGREFKGLIFRKF